MLRYFSGLWVSEEGYLTKRTNSIVWQTNVERKTATATNSRWRDIGSNEIFAILTAWSLRGSVWRWIMRFHIQRKLRTLFPARVEGEYVACGWSPRYSPVGTKLLVKISVFRCWLKRKREQWKRVTRIVYEIHVEKPAAASYELLPGNGRESLYRWSEIEDGEKKGDVSAIQAVWPNVIRVVRLVSEMLPGPDVVGKFG